MKFKVKNKFDIEIFNRYKKERGLKSSARRMLIIDYFLSQDKHMGIEELYNHLKKLIPGIGYSTIYRTIKHLVNCGLASSRQFEKKNTIFEPVHIREHHDHLICIKCKKIIEFFDSSIEKLQRKIARRFHFKIRDHKLEIYGLCLKCARGGKGQWRY